MHRAQQEVIPRIDGTCCRTRRAICAKGLKSKTSTSSNQCLVIRVPVDGKVGLAVEVRLKKEPKCKIAEDI